MNNFKISLSSFKAELWPAAVNWNSLWTGNSFSRSSCNGRILYKQKRCSICWRWREIWTVL